MLCVYKHCIMFKWLLSPLAICLERFSVLFEDIQPSRANQPKTPGDEFKHQKNPGAKNKHRTVSTGLINIRGRCLAVSPHHISTNTRGTGDNTDIVSLTSLEFVKGFALGIALRTLEPAADHIWVKLISLHIPFPIRPRPHSQPAL